MCSGPCREPLPRSAYAASVWRDGFGYCRDCRRAYNAGYGSSARLLVEELRERVGSLGEWCGADSEGCLTGRNKSGGYLV